MRKTYMYTLIVVIVFLMFLSFKIIAKNDYSNKELESYEFNITFIDQHGGFYGDSSDGKGLYFTSDDLEAGAEILIGDKVLAWFPVNDFNTVIKVKKIQ